jgi:hypothetical protein
VSLTAPSEDAPARVASEQPYVPAQPSWIWRRSALLLAFGAQLITISDLVGSDPLSRTRPSAFLAIAPAPLAPRAGRIAAGGVGPAAESHRADRRGLLGHDARDRGQGTVVPVTGTAGRLCGKFATRVRERPVLWAVPVDASARSKPPLKARLVAVALAEQAAHGYSNNASAASAR